MTYVEIVLTLILIIVSLPLLLIMAPFILRVVGEILGWIYSAVVSAAYILVWPFESFNKKKINKYYSEEEED